MTPENVLNVELFYITYIIALWVLIYEFFLRVRKMSKTYTYITHAKTLTILYS